MDNADLEKLSIKPGSLTPKFHVNTTEYSATLPCDVEKLTINCLTSDSNASYQILGSGGERTLPLKEGDVTVIKIEVSAEDGTTKLYQINTKRLSARDASLTGIKVSSGSLQPEFSSDVLQYVCTVSSSTPAIKVTPTIPDKKTGVKVCGSEPGSEFDLNIGETVIDIEVTSADGTNKQVYTVGVIRNWFSRAFTFSDPKQAKKLECPITLAPLYRPVSIMGSDPRHIFSEPIIDELTKTSKQDPLDATPLDVEWKVPERALDKEISVAIIQCPYSYSGCESEMKFSDLGGHAKDCAHKPKTGDEIPGDTTTCGDCSRKVLQDETDWHEATMCTSKHTNREINHSVKDRSWEKRLHQSGGSGSEAEAKKQIELYRKSLPKQGQAGRTQGGKSPLDYLHTAALNLALAVKQTPKQASLHYQLGLVLEEQYYAQDMFGYKTEEEDVGQGLASLSLDAKESSKEDDIQAICVQRGAGSNPPLARQLQAIDEEYKYLLDSGQSGKADYVQTLYIWKSKQALQDGRAAQAASDQETPLGQAYLKYLDALSLDQNNALYNVHVARLLLLQGKADEALTRLQLAVGIKPALTIARFYLGLALAQQKGGAGSRTKEATTYLHDGLVHLLQAAAARADADSSADIPLHSEDLWRTTNIQLFRGCVTLGTLLRKSPQAKKMSAQIVFHSAALLASQNLCSLVARGDAYQSFEWILLDCHSNLLEMLQQSEPGNTSWIAQRCQQLTALIRCSTLPQSIEILQLQEKTCQKGVIAQPTSSQTLCQLGNSQLAMYDNDPASDAGKKALSDARLSYQASIAQEGKPIVGLELHAQLKDQAWWQDKLKEEEAKKAAAEKPKAPAAASAKTTAGKAPAAARGRGAAARGAAARGAATRGAAVPTRGAARGAARGGAAAKGPSTPVRGGTAARGGTTAKPGAQVKTASKAFPSSSSTKVATPAKVNGTPPAKTPQVKEEKPAEMAKQTAPVPSNVPLNRITYPARLGLARALAKESKDTSESQVLYNDVIIMAPQIHDAYIELADFLVKAEPLRAVDVYDRFPFPEESSFDDAYLHGEVVRLLMKHKQFDDTRLEKHMISWGRVMGIGCLEKYVEILDSKFKSKLLMNVYAGVNRKTIEDPDMQAFFKFKMWL